jgi:hypothetical protein
MLSVVIARAAVISAVVPFLLGKTYKNVALVI